MRFHAACGVESNRHLYIPGQLHPQGVCAEHQSHLSSSMQGRERTCCWYRVDVLPLTRCRGNRGGGAEAFSGKSDLFVAMITAELKRTADMYGALGAADPEGLSRALAGYLSLSHVQHPEMGCPLPSLTPEIGRSDAAVRLAFEQGVQTIHANVSALTGSSDTAWAVMAQNVGAVMLARAILSEETQRELLNAVRQVGEQLIRSDAPNQMSSCLSPD